VIEGNVFTANQINQLKYVPRLTKDGFGKRRLTDKIFSVITEMLGTRPNPVRI